MATQRQQAVGATAYALVSGDGLNTLWLTVDEGLWVHTGRATLAVDSDVDASAAAAIALLPAWSAGLTVVSGELYGYDGSIYEVVQGHTTQSDWHPDIVPALFNRIYEALPGEDYPPWVQPTGAQDAYHIGDRVTYNGQNWECTAGDANGNNVWQPGVFGWTVI